MKKKTLLITLVIGLFTTLSLVSGCRHHSGSHRAEFMVDYVTESLDLNADQATQLNQIKDEIIGKAREMHASRETMFNEAVTQLRSQAIDADYVKALIAEHRARMDELIDFAVPRLIEFHGTLTPAQREKLVAKLEKFKDRHHRNWE